MAEKKNPTLKKARQEMTYLTGDEEIKRLAFLREKWEMDRISDINHAKREGYAEGMAEGKAEGMAEGELNKQKEIAKKMLEKGIEIETIAEVTGLSKEEIETL